MTQAPKNKQDVNAYAREHQLDTLFQKLMDKVLKDMPDDPKEYLVNKMNEPQGNNIEEKKSPQQIATSQSVQFFSDMSKSTHLRNSASGVNKWDDFQKAFPNSGAHQIQEPGRSISKDGIKQRNDGKRAESAAVTSSVSIPLRKSIHGMGLEGHNVSFEETTVPLGSVYLRQSVQPKSKDTSSLSSFRRTLSFKGEEHQPQPSNPPSMRLSVRSLSKERNKVQEPAPTPIANVGKSNRQHDTAMHKVAPYIPPEPEPQLPEQDAGAVSGPGRKKKLLIREQKRKHREELIKYIDSVNSNVVDKNGEPLVSEKPSVEEEVELLLRRCRRGFGVSQYMKSYKTEDNEQEVADENHNVNNKRKGSSQKSNTVVVYYNEKGDGRVRNRKSAAPEPDIDETVLPAQPVKDKASLQSALARQASARSAWDEQSTPASPSATNVRFEDFFSGNGSKSKQSVRHVASVQLPNDDGEETMQHEEPSSNRENAFEVARPWLPPNGASRRVSKQQSVDPTKSVIVASASAPIIRSRTSSASSISDIFASGTNGSRRY